MTNLASARVKKAPKSIKLLEKYQAQKSIVRELLSKMFSEVGL